MYYLCSENKGADQLRRYCRADLRLCFHIRRMFVLCRGLILYIITYSIDTAVTVLLFIADGVTFFRIWCFLYFHQYKSKKLNIIIMWCVSVGWPNG